MKTVYLFIYHRLGNKFCHLTVIWRDSCFLDFKQYTVLASSCRLKRSRKNLIPDGIQTGNLRVCSQTFYHCTTDHPLNTFEPALQLACIKQTLTWHSKFENFRNLVLYSIFCPSLLAVLSWHRLSFLLLAVHNKKSVYARGFQEHLSIIVAIVCFLCTIEVCEWCDCWVWIHVIRCTSYSVKVTITA